MSRRAPLAFSDHRVSTAALSTSIIDEFFSSSTSDHISMRQVDVSKGVVKRKVLPVRSLRSLHNQKHLRHSSSFTISEDEIDSIMGGTDAAAGGSFSKSGALPLSPISKNANTAIGYKQPVKEKLCKVTFRVEGAVDSSEDTHNHHTNKTSDEQKVVTLLASDAQVKAFHETNLQNIVEHVFHTYEAVEAIQSEMLRYDNAVELCARLKSANMAYTKLIESAMSEMLTIQRSKTKSQSELKKELTDAQEKLIQARESMDSEKMRSERYREEIERLNSNIRASNAEVQFLKERIDDLEAVKIEYDALKRSTRNISDETERRIREIANSIQIEEKGKFDRLMQQTRKKMIREVKTEIEKEMMEEKGRLQRAAEEESFKEIETTLSLTKKKDDFKRPKVDGSSQTEVDECGVWDKADGWILPVSGTALARQQWRRAILFAKCPSCKGIGRFIGTAAKLFRLMQRGQAVGAVYEVDLKRRAAKWSVPDSIVQFMSNLPRSVQAISPKGKAWVMRRVFTLLHEKKIAADVDDSLGYSVQPLTEFVIEYYLTRSSSRTTAEIELFNLVTTLKDRHKSHSLLQTFCRFLQLLDSYSDKEVKEAQKQLRMREIEKEKRRDKELDALNPRERTRLLNAERDKKREVDRQSKGKAEEARGMAITDCALTIEMMSLYLYARSCMMHEYSGIYAKGIRDRKNTSAVLQANEARLRGEEEWLCNIPAHICICENLKFWIPIDRVLRVMEPILSHLDDESFSPLLRSLEQNARMLTLSSTFNAPEGMRTAVRTIIRRVQLSVSEDGRDLSWHDIIDRMEGLGKPVPESEASFLRMLADYEFEFKTTTGTTTTCETSSITPAVTETSVDSTTVTSSTKSKTKNTTKSSSGPGIEEESDRGLESADVQRRFREDMLMVDMDYVLQLLIEALITRAKYVESSLEQIFKDGDDNGDGVLTFKEFVVIVSKVAPHFHERRILKMFREALTAGNDTESIDPSTFIKVCKTHGLVQLVDIVNLKSRGLKALSATAISKAESEAAKILANAKLMAEAQIAAMVATHSLSHSGSSLASRRHRKASAQMGIAAGAASQGGMPIGMSSLRSIDETPSMRNAIKKVMNVQKLIRLPERKDGLGLGPVSVLNDLSSDTAEMATAISSSEKLPSIKPGSSSVTEADRSTAINPLADLMEPDAFDMLHSSASGYISGGTSGQSSPIVTLRKSSIQIIK